MITQSERSVLSDMYDKYNDKVSEIQYNLLKSYQKLAN